MSDWQVGDLAVCVDASPCVMPAIRGLPFPLASGAVLRVSHVSRSPSGHAVLNFVEWPVPPFGKVGWHARRFRKIRPDEREACEPEFVTLLKRSRKTVRA